MFNFFKGIIIFLTAITLPITGLFVHAKPVNTTTQVKTVITPIVTPKASPVPPVIPSEKTTIVTTPIPTFVLIPTPLPQVPTTAQTNNDSQIRQQIQNSITQYNNSVNQIKQQKLQICSDQTNSVNQKYQPQIDTINQQISQLNDQVKAACPESNPYAEACMVGSIRKQVDYLDAQISALTSQISTLQQEQTSELNSIRTTFCNLPAIQYQPMPVSNYVTNNVSLPIYFHMEANGMGGYIIYDNNSTYLHVDPDGMGGYTVY